jgi:hypothetical protein
MDGWIDGHERRRNFGGQGQIIPNIFLPNNIFFGYCAEEGQIKIIGVRVEERVLCIMKPGSNQTSPSF